MGDSLLQQAVIDELTWEPSVNAGHIGVTARDGVVTLSGHVSTYAEKTAAQSAASKVHGVKALANDIEVRWDGALKQADDDIAQRALQLLAWDIEVPPNKVKVVVAKGWVTLSGELHWQYQRSAAENDVRKLHGVVGVINGIVIKPRVDALVVSDKITDALKRNAFIEASKISVSTLGGKVTLSGSVKSWTERGVAENTAWAAPGVTEVIDNIVVA